MPKLPKYENRCCICDAPGSRGEDTYCNHCDRKLDPNLEDIFLVDGENLCEKCLKDMFRKG